jgi:hypothetical protein
LNHIIDDKKHGFGTYFWPNGKVYIVNWKNGKKDGKGTIQ